MRSTTLLMAATVAVCCFSCKKKPLPPFNPPPPPPPPTVVYPDYTKLKPGNYWIYQNYMVDSVNGAAHAQGTFDSSYVEKDTVIGRNTYHKYVSTRFASTAEPEIQFLRDSLSYIVDNFGVIHFSSDDFSSIFRSYTEGPNAATPDTLYVTERMGYYNLLVAVDAGSFTTSTFQRIFRFPTGYPYGSTRQYDLSYAYGVGLVKATTGIYIATPAFFEKRLVRYHVQ